MPKVAQAEPLFRPKAVQLHRPCSPLLQHLVSMSSYPRINRILTLDLPLPVASIVKSTLGNVLRQTQQSQRRTWKQTGLASDANCAVSLLMRTPRSCPFISCLLEILALFKFVQLPIHRKRTETAESPLPIPTSPWRIDGLF